MQLVLAAALTSYTYTKLCAMLHHVTTETCMHYELQASVLQPT